LQIVAAVSGIYDAIVGVTMLMGVAAGYLIPYREPHSAGGRAYLWVMGPLLKGAGAATFVIDHYVRHSPSSFLLFAVSDGALALITLWALLTVRRESLRENRS
jgi:hypothetical protein